VLTDNQINNLNEQKNIYDKIQKEFKKVVGSNVLKHKKFITNLLNKNLEPNQNTNINSNKNSDINSKQNKNSNTKSK